MFLNVAYVGIIVEFLTSRRRETSCLDNSQLSQLNAPFVVLPVKFVDAVVAETIDCFY